MPVDLNLIGAKILIDNVLIECGIAVDEGKIHKIGKPVNLPKAVNAVDVKGNLVLPGLIDVHVHLRDLGLSYKEDFKSGTCAAAAGGFTTVLDMPNTKPPTNSPDGVKEKIERASRQLFVNIGFYGDFPVEMKNFDEMVQLGVIGFKVNLYNPTTELNVDDDALLLNALKQASELNCVTAIHAEDRSTVAGRAISLQRIGKTSPDAYLEAHPPKAEIIAVKRMLKLIKESGVHGHFSHISVAETIPLIEKAKQEGLSLTCEVTPHHLFLTETELRRLGGIALTDPPIRSRSNATSLWYGLEERVIDVIASDHAPHLMMEKEKPNIWEIPPGIPGLETTLPLLLTKVNRGEMSLSRLIEVLAEKPAEIFGLRRKGFIGTGFDADLTVIDLKRKFTVDASKFYSKAKYSPFDGWQLTGKTAKTFVAGQLIMEDGEIVADPGSGSVLGVK